MATVKRQKEVELWKSPPSLNKWWAEVSNFGRARTLNHEQTFKRLGKKSKRIIKGKIRKLAKDSRGRLQVGFGANKGEGLILMHRLVAECFVPNPKPKEYDMVFFKNGKVSDCRASNLEWGNRLGRDTRSRGMNSVYKIRVCQFGKCLGEYFGCGEVARAIGTSRQAVYIALMEGRGCHGFELQAKKNDGGCLRRTLADIRKPVKRLYILDIPDCLYETKPIDILPKAVF